MYVDHICKKARKTICFIHMSFHSATINTRRTLYLALVRPILEYASTTWHPLNKRLTKSNYFTKGLVKASYNLTAYAYLVALTNMCSLLIRLAFKVVS